MTANGYHALKRWRSVRKFDLFVPPDSNHRGMGLIKSLHIGAKRLKLDVEHSTVYAPRKDSVLVVYGMGGPSVYAHANWHMKTNPVISWDVGYWERSNSLAMGRKYRVSINGLHCPKLIMKGEDPGAERLNQSGLAIRPGGDKSGYILLAGNGPKSNAIGAHGWTLKKSIELRKAFPGIKIVYRPKPKRGPEPGVFCDRISVEEEIDTVLQGARLVVCRHSNVAVDACRFGIPVVCDDGAAAAIYPKALEDFEKQPSDDTRAEFLRRLAWWQWNRQEAEEGQAWQWLLTQL
jgi:hypothetical protein